MVEWETSANSVSSAAHKSETASVKPPLTKLIDINLNSMVSSNSQLDDNIEPKIDSITCDPLTTSSTNININDAKAAMNDIDDLVNLNTTSSIDNRASSLIQHSSIDRSEVITSTAIDAHAVAKTMGNSLRKRCQCDCECIDVCFCDTQLCKLSVGEPQHPLQYINHIDVQLINESEANDLKVNNNQINMQTLNQLILKLH
jgi:hypothetical protein